MRVSISEITKIKPMLLKVIPSCSRHRCPHEEPEHLTVEGEFHTPDKPQYQPVEKVKPIKPTDNLTVEGTFEGRRRTDDYSVFKAERSTIIRQHDNLKVTDGQFYSQTTSQSDYQREIEEDKPLRRNTYTKEEAENLNITSETSEVSTTIRRRTWTKEELEAVKYKTIDRPQQIKPVDNLRPEGEFYSPTKEDFQPAERPKQVKSFSLFALMMLRVTLNLMTEFSFIFRSSQQTTSDKMATFMRRISLSSSQLIASNQSDTMTI
jgi:hypothetical protein